MELSFYCLFVISKYSNEKNYSPDGSENPSLFSVDCNEQQEYELLKMPKISLLKKRDCELVRFL